MVVGSLPSRLKVLGSIPRTEKNKSERMRRQAKKEKSGKEERSQMFARKG